VFPVPEYLAPGVYVEETSFRAKSIEGVSTSTTAFVGPTSKGPLGLKPDTPGLLTPEVITNFNDFERTYGGLSNLSFAAETDENPDMINYMAHAVKAFFDNGGARVFIARTFMPRSAADDGRAKSRLILDGGSPSKQVLFVARMPGSALNCAVGALLKATKVSKTSLRNAPAGSLLRLGGDTPATPALLPANEPPFLLSPGDKLTLKVDNVEKTITFSGAPAEVVGDVIAAPDTIAIAPKTLLTVTVKGHPAETIPLPEGTHTLTELAGAINSALRFGYARMEGNNKLALGTDARGKAASITVSELPELGLKASIGLTKQGQGNVPDLDSVTADDINAVLTTPTATGAGARIAPSTGKLEIFSTATGENAKLSVITNDEAKTSPTLSAALGFTATEDTGSAGGDMNYYSYDGAAWKPHAGAAALNVDTAASTVFATAYLLTMTLLVKDGDGNEIIYDDLGFSPKHKRWAGELLKENPSRKLDAMQNPIFLSIGNDLLSSDGLAYDLQQALFGTGREAIFFMTGGNDGLQPVAVHPPSADEKTTAAYDDCLQILEKIEDISILAAPGHSAYDDATFKTVQSLLISHCEKVKYRIAVLDTPSGLTPGEAMDVRSQIDSTRAALYYPWVVIDNPSATPSDDRIPKEIVLPPSGFVTGIYARTDITRGVWKAPANEIVRGALRFESDITFGQQEVLNPVGVNCLRFFYGRGYRVWGARTASSDPEWKYVNVRRYFIRLERSIDRSTQWAVFEPNGQISARRLQLFCSASGRAARFWVASHRKHFLSAATVPR
jgi:hypothetical protein